MAVRLFFPEAKQPLVYARVRITRVPGAQDLEVQNGDLVLREFGVYMKRDNQETIIPWGSIFNISMERQEA